VPPIADQRRGEISIYEYDPDPDDFGPEPAHIANPSRFAQLVQPAIAQEPDKDLICIWQALEDLAGLQGYQSAAVDALNRYRAAEVDALNRYRANHERIQAAFEDSIARMLRQMRP